MTAQTFDRAQAIARYTELMHLIDAGAYDERDENGNYGADGVEQGIEDLEFLAAKQGLAFAYNRVTQAYTLEPMTAEEKAAFKAEQAAEQEEIARQVEHENRQDPISPSHFDDEWEINNQ